MKRFIVQYVVLIAATVAACLIGRAGHLALALLVMAVYTTVLIWSSYKYQAERGLFDAVIYHQVKDLIKDNQRLAEALIVVTKATPRLKTTQGEVYAINLPGQDHLVLYRKNTTGEEE